MEEVREKKSKSVAWYILIPIFIVIVAFIIYTLIQYFQWTAESPKDIEWSEKDINIG
jgi:phosphotransferase system  glucose/maltose/N-acetylglucosamine-specific IIC component